MIKLLYSLKIIGAVLCLSLAGPAYADSLTSGQIERVKASKELIQDVDKKSLRQTVDELESMDYTEENLQIMEAMARTYAEIVRNQDVRDPAKKEWLYGTIALNMAYLQMGGSTNAVGGNAPLNRLIRRTLQENLSEELQHHPVLFRPFTY